MKKLIQTLALALALCMLCTGSLAAKSTATPTPPPVEIVTSVQEPPAQIRQVLDIAYHEWETLAGKALKKCNKFTEWRGKGVSFGWCGGFITWCMMEAGVEMDILENVKAGGEGPVDGVIHVKEASVGKLLRGYQIHFRTTHVPQPGFLLVYGKSYNKTIHIGLVYDVQELGDGKYRITTIEGNMSNRVKMYVHDYDMNAEKWTKNLSAIPKEERTEKETSYFNYKLQDKEWYVNCFLMPWVPEDMQDEAENAAFMPVIETPPPAAE